MMNADGVTLDHYRTALKEIVVGYKAFNDHSDNYEQLTIAIIKGAALLNGKEPDLSAFEMIDRMEPVDVRDLRKENRGFGIADATP